MDPKAVLAQLAELTALVEKTVTEPEGTVEKSNPAAAPSDLERIIAVSHSTNAEAIDAIKTATTEGFELVAKTVQELAERVNQMPQGRRSAAFAPAKPEVEVTKTATDTDDVQKTAEEQAAAGDLTAALKTLNERTYGVR